LKQERRCAEGPQRAIQVLGDVKRSITHHILDLDCLTTGSQHFGDFICSSKRRGRVAPFPVKSESTSGEPLFVVGPAIVIRPIIRKLTEV
jgi:hypothetical protein